MRISVVFALFALGCGPTGAGADAGPVDRTSYPAGPYGTAEGATLEALSFTTSDGDFSLDADVFADESKKLLLIASAAGWCTACIEEQPRLEEFHNAHPDLAVVVAVFEDQNTAPADGAYADNWANDFSLTFPVVADIDNKLGAFYNTQLAPMTMFVDIDTMEIISVQTGADIGVLESVINSRL